MAHRIFISYRREDDPGHAGRINDHLSAKFKRNVFMDVEGSIRAGENFEDVLRSEVALCDVCLAIIGRRWLSLLTEHPDPLNDFVVNEIAGALELDKYVIPVLVGGTSMPGTSVLPSRLQGLARCQAIEIRAARFKTDVEGLAKQIGRLPTRKEREPELRLKRADRLLDETYYLSQLGFTLETMIALTDAIRGVADARHGILVMLQAVAALARSLHGKNGRIRANLMWHLTGKRTEAWDPYLKFNNDSHQEAAGGLLVLSREYSATDEHYPDPASPNLAMEVPTAPQDASGRWLALPGAPLAFARGEFEHFAEVGRLADWGEKHAADPAAAVEAQRYLQNESPIAGFLSIPVFRPRVGLATGNRPLGVLNLDWSAQGRLTGPDAAWRFCQTIHPLVSLVGLQMARLKDADSLPAPPSLPTG